MVNALDQFLDRELFLDNPILVILELFVVHNSLVERYLSMEMMVHKHSKSEYEHAVFELSLPLTYYNHLLIVKQAFLI